MAHDVFISYAAEDKEVAWQVCRTLEKEGVHCWMAPRDVNAGEDYEEAIVDAITASQFLVLILSAHSNASPHVRREIQNACADDLSNLRIIPLRIDATEYSKPLRYYLGSRQWLDASTPPLEEHLRRLADYVRARVRPPDGKLPPPPTEVIPPARVPAHPPDKRRLSRWDFSLPAAVLLLLGVMFAIAYYVNSVNSNLKGGNANAVNESPGASSVVTPTPANKQGSPTPTPHLTPSPAPPKPTPTRTPAAATPTPASPKVRLFDSIIMRPTPTPKRNNRRDINPNVVTPTPMPPKEDKPKEDKPKETDDEPPR